MAWCPRAKKIRTFVPNRMQELELDKHLEKSFGITTGDGDYEVVLALNEFATQVHKERQWNAQKRWDIKPNGTSILTLQVSSLDEVEMFVLGHSKNVKVQGPPEFVERIKNKAGLLHPLAPRLSGARAGERGTLKAPPLPASPPLRGREE